MEKFVERAAKQKHISITAGGKSPGGKGFFFEPTVVAGAQQNDEIVRKEVFGPVSPSRASTTSTRRWLGPMTATMD